MADLIDRDELLAALAEKAVRDVVGYGLELRLACLAFCVGAWYGVVRLVLWVAS